MDTFTLPLSNIVLEHCAPPHLAPRAGTTCHYVLHVCEAQEPNVRFLSNMDGWARAVLLNADEGLTSLSCVNPPRCHSRQWLHVQA